MWSVSSPNGNLLQMKELLYQIEETMFKRESPLGPLGGGGGGILFSWNYTQATWPTFSSFMSTISGNVLLFSSS